MALFETALRQYLTDLDLAPVYAQHLPQKLPTGVERYPAISFFRVTGSGLPGLTPGPSTLQTALFQIDVWSDSYDEAREVTEALRLGLENYAGMMGGFRVGAWGFSSRDQFIDDAQLPAVHHVIVETTIQYGEP